MRAILISGGNLLILRELLVVFLVLAGISDFGFVSSRIHKRNALIGKFCSIGRQMVIGVGNHNIDALSIHPFLVSPEFGGLVSQRMVEPQRPAPVIGHDVWIEINSVIMRGMANGNGAVVAANSVVTKDVAPYTIVGGSPAGVIKPRFAPDIAEILQRIAWWN